MSETNITQDEQNSNSKVVKLSSKTKEKSEKKPKPKITLGILEDELYFYMQRSGDKKSDMPEGVPSSLPHRKYNIWAFEDEKKDRIPLEITELKDVPGAFVCTPVSIDYVTSKIDECLSIFNNKSAHYSIYRVSRQACKQIALKCIGRGRKLDAWPNPMGFKTQPGYFFQRKSYDCIRSSDFSSFPNIKKMFLDRMTNPETFCQWVGSLTDPNADCSQAIYMYGKGGGGKTFLMNFVAKLSGNWTALDEKTGGSGFNSENLVGKRVGLGDEIDPKWVRSSIFKRITGGGTTLVHRKNQVSISVALKIKIFLVSNDAPEITGDKALTRRLLPIQLSSIDDKDQLPEKEIWSLIEPELPYFEGYCLDSYEALNGRKIGLVDRSGVESAVADFEERFELVFSEYFKLDGTAYGKDSKVTAKEFLEIYERATIKFPTTIGRNKAGFLKDFRKYILKITDKEGMSFSNRITVNKVSIRYIEGIRRV